MSTFGPTPTSTARATLEPARSFERNFDTTQIGGQFHAHLWTLQQKREQVTAADASARRRRPAAISSGSLAWVQTGTVSNRRRLEDIVLAGHPGCTPADGAAGMTDGGSCHAYPVNPCPTYAASKSDLRDHAVRLRNRRRCHGLRRCRNRQSEASNSNQPDHSAPPLAAQSPDRSPNGDGAALMFKQRPFTDFRR